MKRFCLWRVVVIPVLLVASSIAAGQEVRITLDPEMVQSSSPRADFAGLVDEQSQIGDPPSGNPENGWEINSKYWREFPYAGVIDLGRERNVSHFWLYDTHGIGELVVSAGQPEAWKPVVHHETGKYMSWSRLALDVSTRYLRIEFKTPGARLTEIALYEYTPEAHQTMLARKASQARERAQRDAAIKRAQEQRNRRPWIEMPPFGRVRLVDDVDVAAPEPGHQFRESPRGASEVKSILGTACRVLSPTPGEGAYMAFRIGKWGLLNPGTAYVLCVDYPEDQPRSMIVMNGGNETSRAFHTGTTVGDALHPKYVNNNSESLRVPLSGKHESWTLLFHLHDRFPDLEFLRGGGPRPLRPDDGFDVAIAQFSARNDPTSQGAAVSRIRLYEVADEPGFAQPLRLPPAPLPHRQLFWREEMADGVIHSDNEAERGVKNRLDWYRFKVGQMRLLGMNTFSNDLLEFGACQHWDSSPYGGNQWVYYAAGVKDLWPQIVELMGEHAIGVLPYYEYSGSKGQQGLGNQRRCQPLTRDDAYTHITWVETANADITDPDTHDDFRKMLDLTVLRLNDKARMEGIWLRPRWQLPMSFADATRERFARESNGGQAVSRHDLQSDTALLERYESWWFGKRREFLTAMHDYLRSGGIPNAFVLFTAEGSEPGTSFPTWEKRIVTDDAAGWQQIADAPSQLVDDKPLVPMDLARVVNEDLYLEALLAPQMNWGEWEIHHANPQPDPQRYGDTPGILMTHCFNRAYTVASNRTLARFRTPSGLALVRHYALNEHMMFGLEDQPKLGYFVTDVERAGPFCMMAEALAVARGDPTMIGYLTGNNFGRGFPQYVRAFNSAFLALPALPSRIVPNASGDSDVVVRAINTERHGAYYAIVNTSWHDKRGIPLRLPAQGAILDAVTGRPLKSRDGQITVDLYPCQLRSLHAPGS